MSNPSITSIRQLVEEDFQLVNQLVIAQLKSKVGLVEDIGEYILAAGGKRLRPLLTLLTAKACGYSGKKHTELATIIEFLHTATLLHDDVVDVSSLRRGKETANTKWGNAPSILVGDFIFSRAIQLLVTLDSWPLLQLMSDTTNCIAEGEVLQLTKAGNPSADEASYLEIIHSKTAVLFAAATKGAAIIAEIGVEGENALYQYGLDLGTAFQLIDDALDYEGDPLEMGKNVGDDLAEGKPTLPLIYVMQNGSTQQALLVKQAIAEKDANRLDEVIQAVSTSGALKYTKNKALEYTQSAKLCLQQLPDSEYARGLAQLADIAAQRSA